MGRALRLIRRYLAGCWREHKEQVNARDASGALVLKCWACGDVTYLLNSPLMRNGPAAMPSMVLGAPVVSVTVEQPERDKIRSIRR